MSETLRHGLPLLAAGQAQKEVTHNEALAAIDRQLHLAVVSRALQEPPGEPAAGAMYIVAADAAGAWAGQAGRIACFDGHGWLFSVPVTGCLAWIADEGVFSVFDGGWSVGGWPAAGLCIGGRQVLSAPIVAVPPPSAGTVVDAECRAALANVLQALRSQGIVL